MKTRTPKILVIKSELAELKKVENFLNSIFEEFNFEKQYFNKIYLCISEAVINAIRHGNRNDLNKNVSIVADFKVSEIEIQIEDEGDGFDIMKVKNPILKENINSESGRGIFIIKKLSEKMEYNDKGNRVQIKMECK